MRFAALLIITLALAIPRISLAQQPTAPPSGEPAMKIVGLADKAGNAKPVVGIGDDLAVKIDGTAALDPTVYVLFIDGRPLQGLDALFDEKAHALIFILRHSDTNASSWKALLGAPTGLTIPITISLGIKTAQGTPTPSIFGDGKNDRLDLILAPVWRIIVAALALIAAIGIVWGGARRTTWLKDNLLPQISPSDQTYSLGRWQMAFWFTLIFASFVSLYVLLGDSTRYQPRRCGSWGSRARLA